MYGTVTSACLKNRGTGLQEFQRCSDTRLESTWANSSYASSSLLHLSRFNPPSFASFSHLPGCCLCTGTFSHSCVKDGVSYSRASSYITGILSRPSAFQNRVYSGRLPVRRMPFPFARALTWLVEDHAFQESLIVWRPCLLQQWSRWCSTHGF